MKQTPSFERLASLAAFMVPGLALWLPSGYSWGALVLLLCSLVTAGVWLRRPVRQPQAWWLAASMAGMGAVWLLDVELAQGLRSLDKPAKYLVALPCLFYVLAYPPRATALCRGLAVGAAGSGAVALYQLGVLDMERAAGFTNAIQYGNLSLLLGLMCGLWLCARGAALPRWQVAGLVMATLLGLLGSLLSQSRGGWLALALSLPLWAWLLARWTHWRLVWRASLALLAAVVLALATQGTGVLHRLDKVRSEATLFLGTGNAQSSVGQRLAHWQLAWSMGAERPLIGWGHAYKAEKQRRAMAGEVDAIVLQFDHAHNEALDLFAKRGVLGVMALLLFYAVPLAIFWPTRRRLASAGTHGPDGTVLGLRLVGLALPVMYIGFGLTQAFLAHNSGNMFYLFMGMLVYGALQAHEVRSKVQQGGPS